MTETPATLEADVACCRFFKQPVFATVALTTWCSLRRFNGQLLPGEITPRQGAKCEEDDLTDLERNYLRGLDLHLLGPAGLGQQWYEFCEYITETLPTFALTADRLPFASRHFNAIKIMADWPGWSDFPERAATLAMAWGWWGAKAHDVTLLLPPDYLDLSADQQLSYIETSITTIR